MKQFDPPAHSVVPPPRGGVESSQDDSNPIGRGGGVESWQDDSTPNGMGGRVDSYQDDSTPREAEGPRGDETL